MLLFSTILDIEKSLTKDSFIKLVLEWNQGSPHESNVLKGIKWNGEHNIRYGNEKLWIDIEEYRNKNIIAVRFEKLKRMEQSGIQIMLWIFKIWKCQFD